MPWCPHVANRVVDPVPVSYHQRERTLRTLYSRSVRVGPLSRGQTPWTLGGHTLFFLTLFVWGEWNKE